MSGKKKTGKETTSKKSPATERLPSKLFVSPQQSERTPHISKIEIRLDSIGNLEEYSKKVKLTDFQIELTHPNFEVKPIDDCSGEIFICPCPDEEISYQEDSQDDFDVVTNSGLQLILPIDKKKSREIAEQMSKTKLNFNYYVEVNIADLKEINRLVETPLLITLYEFQEKVRSTPTVTIEDSTKLEEKVKNELRPAELKKVDKKKKDGKVKSSKPTEVEEAQPKLDEPQMIKNAIASTCLDLLQYVQNKSIESFELAYIYPISVNPDFKTPLLDFLIKTNEPLQQIVEPDLGNLVTITLESVFNLPETVEASTKILVDVFLVTKADESGGDDSRLKIVTFTNGKLGVYQQSDIFKKWNYPTKLESIGMQTRIETNHGLNGAYNIKNVDISYVDEKSQVFNFNSISQQIISNETCGELEYAMNYFGDQIAVTVRFQDEEKNATEKNLKDFQDEYIGSMDISALLYPRVSSGRFIIPIKQIERLEPSAQTAGKGKKKVTKPIDKMSMKKVGRSLSNGPIREEPSAVTLPTRPTGVLRSKFEKHIDGSDDEISTGSKYSHVVLQKSAEKQKMFVILEISFEYPITETRKKIPMNQLKQTEVHDEVDEADFLIQSQSIEAEFEEEITSIFKQLPYRAEIPSLLFGDDNERLDFQKVEEIPFLNEMRQNLTNTIMKLVATKYNHMRKTTTNQNFKNLMAVVFNDLTERVRMTANRFFSGAGNTIELRERKRKDLHTLIAKEFRQLNYLGIADSITNQQFFQKANDTSNYEETMVDLVINDLENLNYDEARGKTEDIILRNPKHLYALIAQAYIQLIHKNIEVVYPYLTNITEICPNNVEVWALLYALYKKNNYRAGHLHCKMMSEKNAGQDSSWLPFFSTREELFFESNFETSTALSCIYVFLKLATYEFAKFVYDAIRDRLVENQRIIIMSTIDLMMRRYEKGYLNLMACRRNPNNEFILRLYEGHFLYAMSRHEEAIREYQVVYHSPHSKVFSRIAWLRCGFWDINRKKFETAKTYFSTCAKTNGTFLSWYGLGVCFYRTNKFEETELCLSKASDIFRSFPDLWVFLTMLNLKMGRSDETKICFDTASKYHVKYSELWDEMIDLFDELRTPLPRSY